MAGRPKVKWHCHILAQLLVIICYLSSAKYSKKCARQNVEVQFLNSNACLVFNLVEVARLAATRFSRLQH